MKQSISAIGPRAPGTRAFSLFGLLLGLGLGAVAAACSSTNGSGPSLALDSGTSAANDAGAPAQDEDAGDAGEDAAAAPPQAYLRVAHLVPDAPAIDVCIAPHGTGTFQGPLLSQLATSLGLESDAAVPGFAYTQVSAYLPLAPGRYDVRIVPAGASSCSASLPLLQPFGEQDGGNADGGDDAASDDAGPSDAATSDAALIDASAEADGGPVNASTPPDAGADASTPVGVVGDVTNLPPLAFNTHSTLLVAGELHPAGADQALTFALVPDDAILASGAASLRAINAMPQFPSLDFGLGSAATTWLPLLTDVAFAAASAQAGPGYAGVDPNGYVPIAPTSSQPLSARISGSDGGSDVAVARDVEIDLGAIASVIAIGGTTGEAPSPAALLLCIDNQPSGGLLSDCSIAP